MTPDDIQTALNPRASVVVEACAGSGKTWLLVSRVIRLLLDGAKPSEILAITFTRKAAEEMRARLVEWLDLLAKASDEEVRSFLSERKLAPHEIDQLIPMARGLFEAFLLAEPPITMTTFHGWFAQLTQAAPLDVKSGADFALTENTRLLMTEAWQSFVQSARTTPDSDVARSLMALFAEYELAGARKLLMRFLDERGDWWAYVNGRNNPVEFALAELLRQLGIEPEQDYLGLFFEQSGLTAEFQEYASLLERNTDTDKELAAKLQHALATDDLAVRFQGIHAIFIKADDTPRLRKASAAQSKRLGADGETRLLALHERLCAKLGEIRDQIIHQRIYRLNQQAFTAGAALLAHYQQLKASRQVVDFADLEWSAFHLLNHSGAAETIQYKLDCRYRHILLDEFQDTNPAQWLTLKSWLEASIGAGNAPTVFLVGDPKQSIYRFRKADARLFDAAADYLITHLQARKLQANVSRRCSPAVIEAVNRVFSSREHFPTHIAHQGQLPGAVRALPLSPGVSPAPDIETSMLRNPLQEPLPLAPPTARDLEGAQIASAILDLVGKVEVLGQNGAARPAEYRDILILKRARTDLGKYEAALRKAQIPYVSARRGSLLDTLEAKDLTALLEFLIAPTDDLKLAHALRSPIFQCSDEDLCLLAMDGGGCWWDRLKAMSASPSNVDISPETGLSGALRRARQLLQGWLDAVDRLPVHDLLDRIFFQGDVEARYQAAAPLHLRSTVQANLHALMALALETDSGRYPSLPRFLYELADFRRGAEDEAPDEGSPGATENAVRIMTIHGAKGLEAPIVLLADANASPKPSQSYDVLSSWPVDAAAPRHFSLFSIAEERGRARKSLFDDESAIEDRESWNLLYVAMTRAKQMLIVSGSESSRAGDWHLHVASATEGIPECLPEAHEAVLRPVDLIPSVDFSVPMLAVGARRAVVESDEIAFGIHFHAALERLAPASASVEPSELRALLGLPAALFDEVYAAARNVLESPALRRFYDPACHLRAFNEVEYMDRNGEIRRIDRLVEFEDCVWVLDYKSGKGGHSGYLTQLNEYRAAMTVLYPGKSIRCALIFKDGRLEEAPSTL